MLLDIRNRDNKVGIGVHVITYVVRVGLPQ